MPVLTIVVFRFAPSEYGEAGEGWRTILSTARKGRDDIGKEERNVHAKSHHPAA